MANRKKSDWHVDHAKWAFAADKYNTPVLTMDFTNHGEAAERRSHYMGALAYLKNAHFRTDALGNHFDPQPQKPGREVIELKGVYNITKLAKALNKRLKGVGEEEESRKTVVLHLASIPERFGGTGKNLQGDQFRPESDLFSDGQAPALTHVARVVQSRAEVPQRTLYLHESNPETGKHRTWTVPEGTGADVIGKIRESLARRAAMPSSDKGIGR